MALRTGRRGIYKVPPTPILETIGWPIRNELCLKKVFFWFRRLLRRSIIETSFTPLRLWKKFYNLHILTLIFIHILIINTAVITKFAILSSFRLFPYWKWHFKRRLNSLAHSTQCDGPRKWPAFETFMIVAMKCVCFAYSSQITNLDGIT